MTNFSEDKIFKNINNEDARVLLKILNVDSVKVKIWTKELRLFDPKDYVPDIILELDFENLIIELQSTPVDLDFARRALTYVAVGNRNKDNDKPMNLIVLSTAEKQSITVQYWFNEDSVFIFDVIKLNDLDSNEIINTVEEKIMNNTPLETEELILYALIPMIVDNDMEKYIKRVVHNLLQVESATESVKNLSYGIEWLIVDKFVEDEEYRQILCDVLGDRMSLIYEYGERREQAGREEGMKEILKSFINSGVSLSELSEKTGKTIPEIKKILNKE